MTFYWGRWENGRWIGALCCDAPWLTLQYVLSRQSNMLRCAVSQVYGKTCPTPIYGRAGRVTVQRNQYAQSSRFEAPPSGAESGCVREAEWKSALPTVARVYGKTCPTPIYGRAGRVTAQRNQYAQSSRFEAPPSAEESGFSARSGVAAALRPGFSARSGVEVGTADRRPGIRKDLSDSNLWSGRSGCIAMISVHTNVQTRAAPKRRGVGLRAR